MEGAYIIQQRGRREREQGERKGSGGLSKAFCSTDEGISCLDLGGLSICAWGGVFVRSACGEGDEVQDFWGIVNMFDLFVMNIRVKWKHV